MSKCGCFVCRFLTHTVQVQRALNARLQTLLDGVRLPIYIVSACVPANTPGFCSLPVCMNGSQMLDNHRWPVMGTPPQKQPKKRTGPYCKYFHKDGIAMLEGLIHACIGITADANAFCLVNFLGKLIFYEQRA